MAVNWLGLLTPGVVIVALVGQLIDRFAVPLQRWSVATKPRWIQWGQWDDGWSYFWLLLPSWYWDRVPTLHDEWRWHQRVLCWTNRPGEDYTGWSVRGWADW